MTEEIRQLRAARDGRMRLNAGGRYVIDGEPRPDIKVRRRLIQQQLITWAHLTTGLVLRITPEGEGYLKGAERL